MSDRRLTAGNAARVLFRTFVEVFCPTFLKIQVEDPPDLERQSPVILAPNHSSYLDPPVLQMAFSRHITFLMTETIYSLGFANWFFRLWQTIPVPERGSSAGAMKGALRAIRQRRPVCIFPEGRISPDGCLGPGRGGVVTLMARAQVPVIPVAILGTHRMLPKGSRLIRPGRVVLRFGEPIQLPSRPDRSAIPDIAARIMDAIHELGAPRVEDGPAAHRHLR